MGRTRRRVVSWGVLAIVIASGAHAGAGTALVDLDSGDVLESTDARERIPLGRSADLMLVALLSARNRGVHATPATEVAVHVVEPDPGPSLRHQSHAATAELVQVLLLTDSRTAARTLAVAIGDQTIAPRVRALARALRLDATAVSVDETHTVSSFPVGVTGTTNVVDVARLATAVARDPAVRRRIGLDGVPIAGGAVIVRATAPLIATHAPSVATAAGAVAALGRRPVGTRDAFATAADPILSGPSIAVAERDGLELLAVATGNDAAATVWDVLERGFQRYRRVSIVRAGARVERAVRVHGGIVPAFNPKAAETFAVTARRDQPQTVSLSLQLPSTLEAPVDANQRVGEVVIECDGRVLGLVPLVAPMTIAPSRWLDTATRER